MRHVKDIQQIYVEGRIEDAQSALDDLLTLGPRNADALKLRAKLFEAEGRFADEARAWEKVLAADPEDQDAVTYFLGRQMEDREYFYFTDDLAGGGRKFLAYPRTLVTTSAFGLVGCVAFLTVTKLIQIFPILGHPAFLLSSFGLFVLGPWVQIILTYIRSLRAICISPQGIEISTRFRKHTLQWMDLDKISLVRDLSDAENPAIKLVVSPKDQLLPRLEVDLSKDSTAVRARTYLVREITRAFREPAYLTDKEASSVHRKVLTY